MNVTDMLRVRVNEFSGWGDVLAVLLFVKVPGGNGKVVVDLDEASRAWVGEYCASA